MVVKKTKKKIWTELRNHSLEDVDVIKSIEDILISKRGHVFDMPKPGECVILLLSGGMDSVVLWDMLMSEYKLNVYPLFITGKKGFYRWIDHQYRSIVFFEKFYKNKYKNLFHPKFIASSKNLFGSKLVDAVVKNPREIIKFIHEDGTINIQNYSTTSILSSMASTYSQLLLAKKNIKINTVFTANLASDGLLVQNQTLTSLRSIMLNLCVSSRDFEKQFTALFMEKELGHFFSKDFVINWAKDNEIPISRTWTCWKRNNLLPCGDCVACKYRREVMVSFNIEDSLQMRDLKNKIMKFLKRNSQR